MVKFITILQSAEAEVIIEKSRFIAHITRTDTREEADSFIALIRKQYKDATHNVPAFVIGEKQEIQWASDDGEPSGTSGAPILQLLVKEGLTNVTIVVTRYFGGVKLGTGGLVRAYTGVARDALISAGRFEVKDIIKKIICVPYNLLSKVQKSSEEIGFDILNIDYEENLKITISFEKEFEEMVIERINDICQGKVSIL